MNQPAFNFDSEDLKTQKAYITDLEHAKCYDQAAEAWEKMEALGHDPKNVAYNADRCRRLHERLKAQAQAANALTEGRLAENFRKMEQAFDAILAEREISVGRTSLGEVPWAIHKTEMAFMEMRQRIGYFLREVE